LLRGKEIRCAHQKDEAEGGAAGVNGTPATFINGQLVSGALHTTRSNKWSPQLSRSNKKNPGEKLGVFDWRDHDVRR